MENMRRVLLGDQDKETCIFENTDVTGVTI